MGYVCCNGFALVFSVAAIVAVLVGPIILVCLDRCTWRKQIAILATVHLAFSLASMLAAFALAGFLMAGVNAPSFNCGNLKCEEGGVPCSAYTLRYSSGISARYNNTSGHFDNVGAMESWSPNTNNGTNFTGFPMFELVLDPLIAQLNNDTFGFGHMGETSRPEVVCREYSYLANNIFTDGRPVFGSLHDTDGKPINKTCLVLLDANFRSFQKGLYFAQGSASSGWQKLKLNAHTLWCSTDTSKLGPGWLPLTYTTGLLLLQYVKPDTITSINDFINKYNINSNSFTQYALGATDAQALGCQDFGLSQWSDTVLDGLWNGSTMNALQLLSEDYNAWDREGRADYHFPGDHVNCELQEQASKFNQVFQYADALGWNRSGVLFRASRDGEFGDNVLCLDQPHNSSRTNNHPLQDAKLYASLRYQCSSLNKGVLCDFGVDPPLAVGPDGKYLSKKNLPDLANIVIKGSPQTATWVEGAVKSMLVAVAVSNTFSVIFLACWPCLMRCNDKLRDYFSGNKGARIDAPPKRDV